MHAPGSRKQTAERFGIRPWATRLSAGVDGSFFVAGRLVKLLSGSFQPITRDNFDLVLDVDKEELTIVHWNILRRVIFTALGQGPWVPHFNLYYTWGGWAKRVNNQSRIEAKLTTRARAASRKQMVGAYVVMNFPVSGSLQFHIVFRRPFVNC